ncbi:hypothetical protein EXN66_Car018997 [Channa argus]|uniref:Uncharacterized protein n=1 Tax=Channa argus TaxID=215402 RepID=A0A6G1QLR6_CHAAH|nr:hypothetical protein EXN66_Car018997 [Channa argus]
MVERFVVVPVEGGGGVAGEREHTNVAWCTGTGGGEDGVDESEPEENRVFDLRDPKTTVPILKYNREPNKYAYPQ